MSLKLGIDETCTDNQYNIGYNNTWINTITCNQYAGFTSKNGVSLTYFYYKKIYKKLLSIKFLLCIIYVYSIISLTVEYLWEIAIKQNE
jgi:hypothetical protein